MKDRQTFVLTLRPEGPCPEAEGFRRLKALLKAALRSYRLRCVKVTTSDATITAEQITREGDL